MFSQSRERERERERERKRDVFQHHVGGVLVIMFASSVVEHGFKTRSGQTKDYNNGSCYFCAQYIAINRKSKDWLSRNQDNVSEWGDVSFRGQLFQ